MVQIKTLGNNKAVRGITTPLHDVPALGRAGCGSPLTDRGKWLGPIKGLSLVTDGGGGRWEWAALIPCGRHTAHTSDDSQSPNHPLGPLGMGKLDHSPSSVSQINPRDPVQTGKGLCPPARLCTGVTMSPCMYTHVQLCDCFCGRVCGEAWPPRSYCSRYL